MSEVFFKEIKSDASQEFSNSAKFLFIKLITEKKIILEKNIPLKVHFGERGNETFIPPLFYQGIIDYLHEQKITTSFIETNVLYRGSRTTQSNHLQVAKEHGFTQIPIIIADGERGEKYHEITINQKHFTQCKIGAEYQKYQQIIVCSHFKGHMAAGFGGALKMLAMGFAARGGKLDMHSKYKPTINENKCLSCGICINKCDVEAISLQPKAVIDHSRCIGCAGCIAVCPQGAVNHDWGGDHFLEKMTEYAYAATLNKQFLYLNFLANIVKDCDCMGHKMDLLTNNIGIVASLDPVALDIASLDLFQKQTKSKQFDVARKSLEYAEKLGMGSVKYNLVKVN